MSTMKAGADLYRQRTGKPAPTPPATPAPGTIAAGAALYAKGSTLGQPAVPAEAAPDVTQS